jgi:hypothetical protein
MRQFPGHSQILSLSPYFANQISTQQMTHSGRPCIAVTLPEPGYESAALALLSVLYEAKPWPQLLGMLTEQQLMHAAKLAQVWQLPAAADAAAALLKSKADMQSSQKSTADMQTSQIEKLFSTWELGRPAAEQETLRPSQCQMVSS